MKETSTHFFLETTSYIYKKIFIHFFIFKKTFLVAIVHNFFYTKLTAYESVKNCLNVFMKQAKKYMLCLCLSVYPV